MRRTRSTVRKRLCRHARQPFLRRSPSQQNLLRQRTNRTTTSIGSLLRFEQTNQRRHREDVRKKRNDGRGTRRRQSKRNHHKRPANRKARTLVRTRRHTRHGRLRQRILPLYQRHELQRLGSMAMPQKRSMLRQPVLRANPPYLHTRTRRLPIQTHPDEREFA